MKEKQLKIPKFHEPKDVAGRRISSPILFNKSFSTTSVSQNPHAKCDVRKSLGSIGSLNSLNIKDLEWCEQLGQGFFGSVYKVKDLVSSNTLAAKCLSHPTEENRKLFHGEIEIMKELKHPNIIRFYGMVASKKYGLAMLMEFASKGTLRDLIRGSNKEEFSWGKRIRFLIEISSGMSYMHSLNIIHRDLKSENCLIREDNTLVIADLGAACPIKHTNLQGERSQVHIDDDRNENIKRYKTHDLLQVGTAYWMAPEVLHSASYNHLCDVFSFGIVIAEVSARQDPVSDNFPRTKDFGVGFEELKKDCDRESCPDEVFRIMEKCCHLDPCLRPEFSMCFKELYDLEKKLAIDGTIVVGPNPLIVRARRSRSVTFCNSELRHPLMSPDKLLSLERLGNYCV